MSLYILNFYYQVLYFPIQNHKEANIFFIEMAMTDQENKNVRLAYVSYVFTA